MESGRIFLDLYFLCNLLMWNLSIYKFNLFVLLKESCPVLFHKTVVVPQTSLSLPSITDSLFGLTGKMRHFDLGEVEATIVLYKSVIIHRHFKIEEISEINQSNQSIVISNEGTTDSKFLFNKKFKCLDFSICDILIKFS